MPLISFDVSDQAHDEAQQIAAEMGILVEDIARSAFDGYLDGVRAARENDDDELAEPITNVTQLAQTSADDDVALEGTEPWLSTENDSAHP